ncbi:BrxE family protein [Nostoc sp. 'Peltigera membranacea cyanobiont' 232]|uniref:BrxE family protein n=1 Tax=Nostoc sp. 'Peltigera membranacea cyanobiont' 232 TaxID=2014531 RepID=UPI00117D4961|nr:BrxE family protein [Nostoc sp. 'Peltigera membranacea cyanobiont' 232]
MAQTLVIRTDIPIITLRLQVLVLALGEVSTWWRTQYLSPAGLKFLERIYPRTAFAAAIHAAGTAARPVHDASTGSNQIYHLFRLPISIEREVQLLLAKTQGASLALEVKSALGDKDKLMTMLNALTTEKSKVAVGALRLGSSAEAYQLETYKRMAGAYLRGFQTGDRIFPYMEADQE